MEALASEDLRGHQVGLQLYGSEPNLPLVRFLEGAGAEVHAVAPYIYAPASDADRVADLVARLGDGRLDVIAFTSASQVDRLWDVAQGRQLETALQRGAGEGEGGGHRPDRARGAGGSGGAHRHHPRGTVHHEAAVGGHRRRGRERLSGG